MERPAWTLEPVVKQPGQCRCASLTCNMGAVSRPMAVLPLLSSLLIAVAKVLQVSHVALLEAHETGQALHVLVSVRRALR